MMILPLANTLQNCFQNLTSRIAGIDTNQTAGKAFAMGTFAGGSISHGLTAMKEQFKSPSQSNNTGKRNSSGNSKMQGQEASSNFIGRIKNFVNPQMKLSSEKDYNGNTNPIRNVISDNKVSVTKNTSSNAKEKIGNLLNSKPSKAIGLGLKATGSYLAIGQKMAEGNFETPNIKPNRVNKTNYQNTEYLNKIKETKDIHMKGDVNEDNR